MNHLPTFKPRNIGAPLANIVQGGNRIQHPASGRSNAISQNVEGMHKDFVVFQKNLKNLVMLYETRHQLMESLNENGLYTAKCYNEMLDGTPLTRIVARKGKCDNPREQRSLTVVPAPVAEASPSSAEESEFVVNRTASQPEIVVESLPSYFDRDDGIDATEYPDSGILSDGERERLLEPKEGSEIPEESSKTNGTIPAHEPEGVKASGVLSVRAAVDESRLATPQSKIVRDKLSSADWDDGIDSSEYHDSGVVRETLEPSEGSMIPKDFSECMHEPEGLKTSRLLSEWASGEEDLLPDTTDNARGEAGSNNDPPSALSIASGASIAVEDEHSGKESGDPPSKKVFSDDETELSVEKNPNWEDFDSTNNVAFDNVRGGANVIVDDDEDSFTNAVAAPPENELLNEDRKKKGKELSKGDGDEGKLVEGGLNEDDLNNDDEEAEIKELPYTPLITDPDIENGTTSIDENTHSSASCPTDENEGKEDIDYLNISNEGALVVITESPKPQRESQPSTMDSYLDVHKAKYKEMKSKLEEHSHLVEYVKEWMETVSTRVLSRYYEYGKRRSSLNHYNQKVNSLLAEEGKLREKNKPMKPKQIEKLGRNQIKLKGALETHDTAGESLLMLMDEVIHRSWRDAFPLLKRSINFECDFANITFTHMAKLGRSLELLDIIGEEESIAAKGRLKKILKKTPEEIFTGSVDSMADKMAVN